MKWLDPIKKLYDLYSEEEDSSRIVEVTDLDSDIEELAGSYMDL